MKQALRDVRSFVGGIIRGERPYAARSARLKSAPTPPKKPKKKELPPKGRVRDASPTKTLPSPKSYYSATPYEKDVRRSTRNAFSRFDPCKSKPSPHKAGKARQEQRRNPAAAGPSGPRIFKKWC